MKIVDERIKIGPGTMFRHLGDNYVAIAPMANGHDAVKIATGETRRFDETELRVPQPGDVFQGADGRIWLQGSDSSFCLTEPRRSVEVCRPREILNATLVIR